jgi:hypothetical protein
MKFSLHLMSFKSYSILEKPVLKRNLVLLVQNCFNWFLGWFFTIKTGFNCFKATDAVYRFLNHSGYAWRRFLSFLSSATVEKVHSLASKDACFIVDDSMFDRNRSKAVELLAQCFDHAKSRYYKGFRMLTLGWSDGQTFIPLDFSLLSSPKSSINGISADIDKRSSGYKRRMEALKSAPETYSGNDSTCSGARRTGFICAYG